ncbi:uncharacterized protein LOC123681693 [Harmonia axyridis]|uniref:uncharacterized protein LOC123681693 n=1 Tax=Harmonia axyridis TaxID=115357 RepID=UPI001E278536|nr:uncharacterized protein LOC123681693 [Harmonia axyridis]
MYPAKFVLNFSIVLSCLFFTSGGTSVKSCYYCNGNCSEFRIVNCTRPESGCISYMVRQNHKVDTFKNCYASATWNCDRVGKWISNKYLQISVMDCQVCQEDGCNKNTFQSMNTSPRASLSCVLVYFIFLLLFLFI